MEAKKEFRENLLKKRESFDQYKYLKENESIIKNTQNVIDSLYKRINRNKKNNFSLRNINIVDTRCALGLYWPLKGEPDLFKLAIREDWAIALPKLFGPDMEYVSYQLGSKLEEGGLGKLMQPQGSSSLIPKLIIVPGLAFSLGGYRLGFGRGHYDKYLAKIKKESSIIKIGVCFHDALFEYLPYDKYDIKFDYIITDKIIIQL